MRLQILVQDGSLSGQTFELYEGTLCLGRGFECDLRFDSKLDPGVSTEHALLVGNREGFYVVDQNSTNGTQLNGKKVESAWLSSGDIIQLGHKGPHLRVEISSQNAPQIQQPTLAPATTTSLRQELTSLSFYNPDHDKGHSRYLGAGVIIFFVCLLAFIVMLLLFSTVGFTGTMVGAGMAFLLAPFYLFIYLWMDRYDPEPAWALGAAYGWGALVAIIVSFLFNTLFGSTAALFVGDSEGGTLTAVLSAPFIEELTKGTGVVLIFLVLRSEFDGVLDGIVYGGVVALGFATVENVLYYGKAFSEGESGLALTFFLRGILSPFVHSLFTSMTGIGCGIAREGHNKLVRVTAPVLGFGAAMMLHSLWNFSASAAGDLFFFVYIIVWIPLFLIFVTIIFFMARRERNIIRRILEPEVNGGFLTRDELELAGSLRRRMRWVYSAATNWKKMQARRKFLRAVTKLAFCYWHVERANAANYATTSLPQIPRFRAEVNSLRALAQ